MVKCRCVVCMQAVGIWNSVHSPLYLPSYQVVRSCAGLVSRTMTVFISHFLLVLLYLERKKFTELLEFKHVSTF